MHDFSKDLQTALKAARAGARIIYDNFEKLKDFQVKDHSKGLVTTTDLEAEKAIIAILKEQSSYGILSEESGLLNKKHGPIWVVDPLDGTNNFARSLPFFAVSIGLMVSNESMVGVIIDPINKKEYSATKGGGAFLNGRKIILPDFKDDYLPMIFLNHGYGQTDRSKFKKLSGLLASDFNILKLGTTALELCYISIGSVDGFIASGGEIWDFTAGVLIARETGYTITDWQGEEWKSPDNNLLICRTEIHKKLINLINIQSS